jgi:alpha-D-ribose 1-methylphosphonate 5-phosphate C-P lyase
MFMCSDTDYCATRRKQGHVGAQGVPYKEDAA